MEHYNEDKKSERNKNGTGGMRYEIYLDTLFIKLLVYYLCVMAVMNQKFGRVAVWWRIALGAFAGVGILCALMLAPMPLWVKCAFFAMTYLLMIAVSFPVHTILGVEKILEEFLKCSLLLGGALWVIMRMISQFFPVKWKYSIMLALSFILTVGNCGKKGLERMRGDYWSATLIGNKQKIRIKAIVDTGNTLYEPISGKAVCVLDSRLAAFLWEEQEPYRLIPYHCVGVEHGFMQGYLLKELRLEKDGPEIIKRDVVIALSPEALTNKKVRGVFLIHPDLVGYA